MKRTVFYIRHQDDKERAAQQQACERFAKKHGITAARTFADADSAHKPSRPGLKAMLQAAERNELRRVVVHHPSQLSRSRAERLAIYKQLQARHVELIHHLDDPATIKLAQQILDDAIVLMEDQDEAGR